jgi:hypothetical protein
MFSCNVGVNMKSVTDGVNRKILVVEADREKAIRETKSEDSKIDPEKPTAGLGHMNTGNFAVLAVDGSVEILAGDVDPRTL